MITSDAAFVPLTTTRPRVLNGDYLLTLHREAHAWMRYVRRYLGCPCAMAYSMAAEALHYSIKIEASSLAVTSWLDPASARVYERLQNEGYQRGARLILSAPLPASRPVSVYYRARRLGTLPRNMGCWLRPLLGSQTVQPTLAEIVVQRSMLGTPYPNARVTLCHVGRAVTALLADAEQPLAPRGLIAATH